MTDILLEIFRAAILLGIVIYLAFAGHRRGALMRRGWNLILAGFLLLLFGSVLDVTDNFESLNRFVVIGDTEVEAVLEKFVGYLGGFIALATGIVLWIPTVQQLSEDVTNRTLELQQRNEELSKEVDKRKQTETALVKNEEPYRNLIEGSLQGIYIHQDGKLVFVNDAIVEMLGYESQKDLMGLDHIDELWSDGDRDRMISYRERRKQGDQTVPAVYEVQCRRKDGTAVHFIQSARSVSWNDRLAVQCVAVDVTMRKHAEASMLEAQREAEAANASKSLFLAAMSHDLRTPLNAIIGFADIIHNRYFGDIESQYRDYASDIRASGEHLLALVDQILDLSVIESGTHSIYKERQEVQDILDWCEKTVLERARSQGVALHMRVVGEPLQVFADRRGLVQILLNLVTNGIKNTPAGGEVVVTATGSSDGVTFSVTDTGTGIRPEDIDRIMQPFNRAESDPFLSQEGWGLGLAITKGLVELHEGTFALESQVGEGTTATLTIPHEA